MSLEKNQLTLPDYQDLEEVTAVLNLPFSISELHGLICGYLCVGAAREGEAYLHALMGTKKDKASREAALALFNLFSVSQQQITSFDFDFNLVLPHDHEPLHDRAQAFSEWCEGFSQAMKINAINVDEILDEDAQDTVHHISEFALLDYDSLEVGEDDEKALFEVQEYARMAILGLHRSFMSDGDGKQVSNVTH